MEHLKKKKIRKTIRFTSFWLIIGLAIFLLIDNLIMPLYVQKGKTIKVPDVIGFSLEEAQKKLDESELVPKISEFKMDKRFEIGTVIFQNPSAGSEVKYGRGVYLTISGGEELILVPNLRGKSIREAIFNLERNGLKLGNITYEPSDEFFSNTIIRQDKEPNSKVKTGAKVDIVVSQGKTSETHLVPDVTLKTLTEAEKILRDNGFQIGKISYQLNLDVLPNTVLEQVPNAGNLMPLGYAIDLIIAQKVDKKN